jgi:hypothetical protein
MAKTSKTKPDSAAESPGETLTAEPPEYLSESSRQLYRDLVRDFDLGGFPEALAVLHEAMTARDRAEAARTVLAAEGLTVIDQRGSIKSHPCAAIARESQAVFLNAMRSLRLDPGAGKKGIDHAAG